MALQRGRREPMPHGVLLDILGETAIDGRPAAGMRECAPVEQALDAGLLKAPYIVPESPIAQPCDPAMLG